MHQFITIEGRSCNGAHKKNSSDRRASIGDIVAEMTRESHACPHVESPRPPVILHGFGPNAIPGMARDLLAEARNSAGHKLRRDAPIAVIGVATWPVPRAVCEDDPAERDKYVAWRADTVGYLKKRWGDALISVVEHVDENHPHVHFCVLPPLPADRRLTIAAVHPGHRAALEASKAGLTRRQQQQAYKSAMVAFQDHYHQEVGARHGLSRMGPGRQRVPRPAWKAQMRQVNALAARYAEVEAIRMAGEQDLAQRAAILEKETARRIAATEAAAKAKADEKVSSITQKVADFAALARHRWQELERNGQEKDLIIARQQKEKEELLLLLAEHGICLGPKI
jgi:hypothetical protein